MNKNKWTKKGSLIKKLFGDINYQNDDSFDEDNEYEDHEEIWNEKDKTDNSDESTLMKTNEPKMDLIDNGKEYQLTVSIPGFKSSEIDIDIETSQITIYIASSMENQVSEGDFISREIYMGESTRTISLPEEVDTNSSQATLKDGILKVVIQKFDKKKRSKVVIKKI